MQNIVKHSKNYVSHSKQQYEAKICKNSLKFAKNLNLLKMAKFAKFAFNVQNIVKHSKNYVSHSKQQYEAKIC